MRDACEKAKFALDNDEVTTITMENIDGDGTNWSYDLTRDQFNECVSVFESRYISCIESALSDA